MHMSHVNCCIRSQLLVVAISRALYCANRCRTSCIVRFPSLLGSVALGFLLNHKKITGKAWGNYGNHDGNF